MKPWHLLRKMMLGKCQIMKQGTVNFETIVCIYYCDRLILGDNAGFISGTFVLKYYLQNLKLRLNYCDSNPVAISAIIKTSQ